MTDEKPSIEEIGEMSELRIANIFDLRPYDARLLKDTSSNPFYLDVLMNHDFSLQDMAEKIGRKVGEVARRRHLLIKGGYEVEKNPIFYEHKSPEGDRIIAWLNKLRFHCASYDEISRYFNKPKEQVAGAIVNLRIKGRVNTARLSQKTVVAYLPGEGELMGEYIAKKEPKNLDRYQKFKRTIKLRNALPKKAFDAYYKNTHETEHKVLGIANILEINN